MLIRFANLGQIRETQLGFRPFTAIIGPNNSNKTYVAYSIYGAFQKIRLVRQLPSFQVRAGETLGEYRVPVTRSMISAIRDCLIADVREFQNDLGRYFQDSSGKVFNNTHIDIEITDDEIKKAASSVSGKFHLPGRDIEFSGSNSLIIAREEMRTLGEERLVSISTKDFVRALSYRLIVRTLFPDPFLLPAERNAFVITYKVLAQRRYRLLRDRVRVSDHDPSSQLPLFDDSEQVRYPTPIEDFLDFLSEAELKPRTVSRQFLQLASIIENEMQGKNRLIAQPRDLGGTELMVGVGEDLRINLYNASSSFKQLAPLILYLRQRAKPNDLLIIDEPEMNLHPIGQAKLLEVLGILVSMGIQVLLTTHSPYLMAHLNNLVLPDEAPIEAKTRASAALYLRDSRAFLSNSSVSAYEMLDGQLVSLLDDDFGIRWGGLSDTASDLQNRYYEIHEALGAKS